MPKRGANIYKRKDGRWEARYVKEITVEGKKKYASVYANSYREVKDKQLYAINHMHLMSNQHTNITISELMWKWLSSIKDTIKKTTYQKYESIIRIHIIPNIGDVQIKFVTGKTIDNFSSNILVGEHKVSSKTVNDILIVIGSAFSYAEDEYNISKPKFHRVKEEAKEMRVLSVPEQAKLEQYLINDLDIYKFGVILALYTGMRIGELCALQWSDINGTIIVINKTLHRIQGINKTVLEVTEPKTKSSNRVIPIPSFLLPMIAQFKSSGSVLTNSKGNVVEPRLMQLKFEKYIKECGLSKTNFHALRHTFATRCVEAGFDIKSLSEILGHSDVKITLNRYVHSSFKLKQKYMELLKPLVNK